jgi:sugar (pentulose or hexulose) kinase
VSNAAPRWRTIRRCDAGSQSPAAVQLTADVFGLPASRSHTHETAGLGAAIDAAVRLRFHPSFEAAVTAMTRFGETRDPDPAASRVYDELDRTVYRRRFERLRPLYAEIRRITGYPPEV